MMCARWAKSMLGITAGSSFDAALQRRFRKDSQSKRALVHTLRSGLIFGKTCGLVLYQTHPCAAAELSARRNGGHVPPYWRDKCRDKPLVSLDFQTAQHFSDSRSPHREDGIVGQVVCREVQENVSVPQTVREGMSTRTAAMDVADSLTATRWNKDKRCAGGLRIYPSARGPREFPVGRRSSCSARRLFYSTGGDALHGVGSFW